MIPPYRTQGLVVIGVHALEFAFEKNLDDVRNAVAELKIEYPVAIDNDHATWRAFRNEYWPAHYFIDAQGRIRHHHFGVGDYEGSERVIQQLLAEAGGNSASNGLVSVNATGAKAAADMQDVESPETHIGYARAENSVSPGGAVRDTHHLYDFRSPRVDERDLSGEWTIGGENAVLNEKGGSIAFRFDARDLYLVLGRAPDGAPVRFRVAIDGIAPGSSHEADIDADSVGTITQQRLYQFARLAVLVSDHTFMIEFLDPGAQAFAFTFG